MKYRQAEMRAAQTLINAAHFARFLIKTIQNEDIEENYY